MKNPDQIFPGRKDRNGCCERQLRVGNVYGGKPIEITEINITREERQIVAIKQSVHANNLGKRFMLVEWVCFSAPVTRHKRSGIMTASSFSRWAQRLLVEVDSSFRRVPR